MSQPIYIQFLAVFFMISLIQGIPLPFVDDRPRHHSIPFHRKTDNQHQPHRKPQQFPSPSQKLSPPLQPHPQVYEESPWSRDPAGYNPASRSKRHEEREMFQHKRNSVYHGQEQDKSPNNYRKNDHLQQRFRETQQNQNSHYPSNSGNFQRDMRRRDAPQVMNLNQWQVQPEHESPDINNKGFIKKTDNAIDQTYCVSLKNCKEGSVKFPDKNVLRVRGSSLYLGNNLEIVRIELDISDVEDNEETRLELEETEDQ